MKKQSVWMLGILGSLAATFVVGCPIQVDPTPVGESDTSTEPGTDTVSGELDTCGGGRFDEECGPDITVDPFWSPWISITGGTFQMGSTTEGEADEQPAHSVTVPSFKMLKIEVTVDQYGECVTAGACTVPGTGEYANWGVAGHEHHPVNYVNWHQCVDFCTWVGGRLLTESEWEYAARNGLSDGSAYTWGNEPANCDYAVMNSGGAFGCGMLRTWPVCSKYAGSTVHGACDMAGNVHEWVQDTYHGSYDCDANPGADNCTGGGAAPVDGSAWEGEDSSSSRVRRGGNFSNSATYLRAADRGDHPPSNQHYGIGCRCAS